jgi:hypothetical protein
VLLTYKKMYAACPEPRVLFYEACISNAIVLPVVPFPGPITLAGISRAFSALRKKQYGFYYQILSAEGAKYPSPGYWPGVWKTNRKTISPERAG